jgi:signal transduction histidine kinase
VPRHTSVSSRLASPPSAWHDSLPADHSDLLTRSRLLESLLDSFPDCCILLIDHLGTVRSIHGDSQDLLGVPAQQLLGCLLSTYEAANHLGLRARRVHRLLLQARHTGRAQLQTRVVGTQRVADVVLTLLDIGDHFACILEDRTDVCSMEMALLRRNNELQQAAERLKEVDILKNEFLSNVSHELRTPLTAIIAYTEALLMKEPDQETLGSFLRVISDQSQKLQQLIRGLLDISKLDSLATELKLTQMSLNEVVRAAIVTVKPTADSRDVQLQSELAAELPLVYLDELRSQQIVWNLLTNAIKFSPRQSQVRVCTWADATSVWCSVTDQGSGIAAEHQELIFRKFVQVDGSTTRKQGGVGLGLDLVRHLLELHGGSISVDSEPGRGACFTFSIPIEKRSKPRLDRSPRTIIDSRTSH